MRLPRLTYPLIVAALAVGVFAAPTAAQATLGPARIATCGNPYYGGKVMPKLWDAGCTGTIDLYRKVRWTFWGDHLAKGTGLSSTGVRVHVRAWRGRMCLSRGTETRRFFYTRHRIHWAGHGAVTYRVPCHKWLD